MNLAQFSRSGKWWFPGKYENKFNGKLEYNESEGGFLFLSDNLEKLFNFPFREGNFILVGEVSENTNEGVEYTRISVLVDYVLEHQERLSENRANVNITLQLKYIFIGIEINDMNIEFEKVSLSFSNLVNWISIIDLQNSIKGVGFCSPEIIVNNKCRIQILADTIKKKVDSKLTIERNIKFIVEAIGDKTLDNYLSLNGILLNFLNFTITKEVRVQSFEGLYKTENELTNVKILYHSTITEKMHKLTVKSRYLFHYKQISNKLDLVLQNWFDLSERSSVIMDLYFGVMYNVESYLSNNLLMLFTALEAYHRAYIDSQSLKKKEKNVFTSVLLEKVTTCKFSKFEKEKLKEWIKEKSELSFKERFEEIYNQFSEILPYLSHTIGDQSNFVKKVVKFRNDISHGNIPYNKINNNNLFWLNQDLHLLLQLCILSKMAFSMDEINEFYLLDQLKRQTTK